MMGIGGGEQEGGCGGDAMVIIVMAFETLFRNTVRYVIEIHVCS